MPKEKSGLTTGRILFNMVLARSYHVARPTEQHRCQFVVFALTQMIAATRRYVCPVMAIGMRVFSSQYKTNGEPIICQLLRM